MLSPVHFRQFVAIIAFYSFTIMTIWHNNFHNYKCPCTKHRRLRVGPVCPGLVSFTCIQAVISQLVEGTYSLCHREDQVIWQTFSHNHMSSVGFNPRQWEVLWFLCVLIIWSQRLQIYIPVRTGTHDLWITSLS